tara:strand:- start:10282 stop:12138 length:1857 start_codon:yes stop_codon:yes gene_type:complete
MNQYLNSLASQGQEYGNSASNIASTVASNHYSGLMNEETNKEIYKQGVHALNGMIGESSAESALMLGHMGYSAYNKYKNMKAGTTTAESNTSARTNTPSGKTQLNTNPAKPESNINEETYTQQDIDEKGDVGLSRAGDVSFPTFDTTPDVPTAQNVSTPFNPLRTTPQGQGNMTDAQYAQFTGKGDALPPATASSGVASGTTAPKMVTSGAQTDTPKMGLKGAGLGEGSKYTYDPSRPGMLRRAADEGGATVDIKDIGGRDSQSAADAREKDLMEKSQTERGRAYRASQKSGGDYDPDMSGTEKAPPLVRWAGTTARDAADATDLSIKPTMSKQQATMIEQRSNLDRLNQMGNRVGKNGKTMLENDNDPIIPQQRPSYRRGAFKVDAGGRSGYNPLDTPQARMAKTTAKAAPPISTQTEPIEPIKQGATAEPELAPTPTLVPPSANPAIQKSVNDLNATNKISAGVTENKPSNEPETLETQQQKTVEPATPQRAVQRTAPQEKANVDPVDEGGAGGGLAELMGGGMALKDAASGNLRGAGTNLGIVAGTEAAESAIPGLGEVLMAGTAVGSLISDLVEKSKESMPKPPPMPQAPIMAFASASPLDSTSYRAPMGGIGS